jgi:hypothetical protein
VEGVKQIQEALARPIAANTAPEMVLAGKGAKRVSVRR